VNILFQFSEPLLQSIDNFLNVFSRLQLIGRLKAFVLTTGLLQLLGDIDKTRLYDCNA